MPKAAAKAPRKKAVNGYKMPDPIPKGEVLSDMLKRKWKLGKSIGKGGFGEIYEAQDASTGGAKYPYVVKIEPHQNGPLFVEMNFYLRVAKKEHIAEFATSRDFKTFGMPPYISSGSHEFQGEKYRFLITEKYGKDIWKYYLENNKRFPDITTFKLGIQVLDALEYIHSKEYIHADIKGANILRGLTKGTENQAYLVDFGLATKYTTAAEFKPDPKRAHDGTIEYLSRDAHKGVPTRRGDIEILLYNLIHWLGQKLPWENCLNDPKAVEESKNKHIDGNLLGVCFGKATPPKAIVDYLDYLKKLKFNTEPDYKKLRSILLAGLKAAGGTEKSPLVFESVATPSKRKSTQNLGSPAKKRRATKTPVANKEDSGDEENSAPKPKKAGGRGRKKLEETDGHDSEVETPKKRGRKPAASKKPVTKKTATIKPTPMEEENLENSENEDSDSGQSTVSETAEMARIRSKIALKNGSKKAVPVKKATTPAKKSATPSKKASKEPDLENPKTPTSNGRVKRAPKLTKYVDDEGGSDLDDIISGSEDEAATPKVTQRKAVRGRK